MTTLKDIARIAGVSVATVSLALNGKPEGRVSAEMVNKIEEIAKKLNYQPDVNAQRLKGKKMPLVGLLVPNITNPFYSEMTKGIMDAGRQLGYHVVLFNADNSHESEAVAAEAFISMKVAGAIICGICDPGAEEERILETLSKAGIRVLMIDRSEWDGHWPRVMIDNFQAAYDSVKYLYRQGHRKIALIAAGWDLNILNNRETGYKKAMEDLGLDSSFIYRIPTYQLTGAGAEAVAKEVMSNLDRQTAVLVIPGDTLAIECILYWKSHGIRIPEDLSVVGFDNIYMCQVMDPPLTTVDQPKYEMGKGAMELLVQLIDQGSGQSCRQVYAHKIVERSTVKKID
ncbi:LacI family DNA-binding transcriptional regulator [Lachnoclostridium edouardi]|uniref:LacI family DNA-binding transcriptional regulator n=1 Tax=Lachnoclostridium edouardi TaxID=1926283 RepID=UPI001A9A655B|nr:LacI family DNA-binding transcriptional regulator [Lachnoclostridium edouardi]